MDKYIIVGEVVYPTIKTSVSKSVVLFGFDEFKMLRQIRQLCQ